MLPQIYVKHLVGSQLRYRHASKVITAANSNLPAALRSAGSASRGNVGAGPFKPANPPQDSYTSQLIITIVLLALLASVAVVGIQAATLINSLTSKTLLFLQ